MEKIFKSPAKYIAYPTPKIVHEQNWKEKQKVILGCYFHVLDPLKKTDLCVLFQNCV